MKVNGVICRQQLVVQIKDKGLRMKPWKPQTEGNYKVSIGKSTNMSLSSWPSLMKWWMSLYSSWTNTEMLCTKLMLECDTQCRFERGLLPCMKMIPVISSLLFLFNINGAFWSSELRANSIQTDRALGNPSEMRRTALGGKDAGGLKRG